MNYEELLRSLRNQIDRCRSQLIKATKKDHTMILRTHEELETAITEYNALMSETCIQLGTMLSIGMNETEAETIMRPELKRVDLLKRSIECYLRN